MVQFIKQYKIFKTDKNTVLYEGEHTSFKKCVEQAVKQGYELINADLSGQDLSHINVDGGNFTRANFYGSNCVGVNMSECMLAKAQFSEADVSNACLCESDLTGAQFLNSYSKDTDVSYSKLKEVKLSGKSCLNINFKDADVIENNVFYDLCGVGAKFSSPPITVNGLLKDVAIIEHHVLIDGLFKDMRVNEFSSFQDNYKDLAFSLKKMR